MLARIVAVTATCLLLLLGTAVPASAQEVDRIAALVNDDMITVRDLEARLKLAIVMSNLQDSLENRRRAVPQVLRKMVDERLQMQEASRVKVNIGADEINRSIANIERGNRMRPGQLLASLRQAGVDVDAVREQIRADVTWVRVMSRVLGPNIKVGEDEITDRIDLLKQRIGRPEYMLAEIFLAVDNPKQEEEARKLGERLLEQVRAGAPFPALARQFSQSGSAGNGGMLGWVIDTAIDDEIKSAVAGMNKGDVSPLIRVGTGFNIVTVLDKRIAGAHLADDETMTIAQVLFPRPVASGGPSPEQLKAKATELTQPIKGCRDFEEFGRKLGSDAFGRMENGRKSELPPQVLAVVKDIALETPSRPVESPEGYFVYMVCSRTALGQAGALPSRDVIRRQIEEERLELQGKRYLRDLRRAAFVEFRL
ncbi:parvulin peptidyl-prolyl isomerase [Paramagnetospirillum marisnigri]|uniref:Parvulin-like PPIase n=1 Tax=Paramagnetospirillum marisnigri TaxID=1285242 RepID=A0A178MVV1_9PROT|nr:peptidylprolyl isomerase [Paramagnetospirillum marisnigri]OAN53167.1 parvulin peptidyl-prolyl isomerase [Paramagnetospirillum marisnigri]